MEMYLLILKNVFILIVKSLHIIVNKVKDAPKVNTLNPLPNFLYLTINSNFIPGFSQFFYIRIKIK